MMDGSCSGYYGVFTNPEQATGYATGLAGTVAAEPLQAGKTARSVSLAACITALVVVMTRSMGIVTPITNAGA